MVMRREDSSQAESGEESVSHRGVLRIEWRTSPHLEAFIKQFKVERIEEEVKKDLEEILRTSGYMGGYDLRFTREGERGYVTLTFTDPAIFKEGRLHRVSEYFADSYMMAFTPGRYAERQASARKQQCREYEEPMGY